MWNRWKQMAKCPVQENINSTVCIFIVKLHFHISMRDASVGYKPSKAFLFVDQVTLAKMDWNWLLSWWKHSELVILQFWALSEEIWQCSCGGWRSYLYIPHWHCCAGEVCWTGIALVKLHGCDLRVKRGISHYLENRLIFGENLISLLGDTGMWTLKIWVMLFKGVLTGLSKLWVHFTAFKLIRL